MAMSEPPTDFAQRVDKMLCEATPSGGQVDYVKVVLYRIPELTDQKASVNGVCTCQVMVQTGEMNGCLCTTRPGGDMCMVTPLLPFTHRRSRPRWRELLQCTPYRRVTRQR